MQRVEFIGQKVGVDKQGNSIYLVPVNGIEIGYKLIGSGEPLVMIMGMGSTMEFWPIKLIELLSKKYQLILFDNRGMGYSTVNDEEFSIDLFARDVVALLDILKIKRAHVMGISMGGTISQQLLLEYSEHFDKVILNGTTLGGGYFDIDAIKHKLPKDPLTQRQINMKPWETPLEKLSHISNQVMVSVGTEDNVVGVESSKILATNIPGAWLIQLKNVPHILREQDINGFTNIILAFLNS